MKPLHFLKVISTILFVSLLTMGAFAAPPNIADPDGLPTSVQNQTTGNSFFFYNPMDYTADLNFIRTVEQNNIMVNFLNFSNNQPTMNAGTILKLLENKLSIGVLFQRTGDTNSGDGQYTYDVTNQLLDANGDGIFDRNDRVTEESFGVQSSGSSLFGALTGHYQVTDKIGAGLSYQLSVAKSKEQAAYNVGSGLGYASGVSSMTHEFGPWDNPGAIDTVDSTYYDPTGTLADQRWKHKIQLGANMDLGKLTPNFYLDFSILARGGIRGILNQNNAGVDIFTGSGSDTRTITSSLGEVSNPYSENETLSSTADLGGIAIGFSTWIDFNGLTLLEKDFVPSVYAGVEFEKLNGKDISRDYEGTENRNTLLAPGSIENYLYSQTIQDAFNDYGASTIAFWVNPLFVWSFAEKASIGFGVSYSAAIVNVDYGHTQTDTETEDFFDGDTNDTGTDPTATGDPDDYRSITSTNSLNYQILIHAVEHSITVPFGVQYLPADWFALRAGVVFNFSYSEDDFTVKWNNPDESETITTYGDGSTETTVTYNEGDHTFESNTTDRSSYNLNLGMGFMSGDQFALDLIFTYLPASSNYNVGLETRLQF